jgi:DNA invertase Pin-like site-specific DNA recombinase
VAANERKIRRCAIYTRKSSEHGLEQDFNSLDAQREAAEAYIKSQAHEGWRLVKARYDDGGISGGTIERPALQVLMTDIEDAFHVSCDSQVAAMFSSMLRRSS